MNPLYLATRTVLSKYATFSGRASRPELWWWFLALFILLAITSLIDGALIVPMIGFEAFQEQGGQPLSFLVALAVVLPNIAVGVRRLHDTGRSGWWLLLGLVPVVGTLVIIYFYVQPSEGENGYGTPQPFGLG
ncbi:hypothetical protein CSC82_15020 [Rhodobacteraceae bacterium 4F10]|nr:hypothetical protein CSC82_15020 [Rhodobacteraceae bacterium 4F10]